MTEPLNVYITSIKQKLYFDIFVSYLRNQVSYDDVAGIIRSSIFTEHHVSYGFMSRDMGVTQDGEVSWPPEGHLKAWNLKNTGS